MKKVIGITFAVIALLLAIVGCDREVTTDNMVSVDNSSENCLECHNGLLDQAQGEWVNSIHASGNNIDYTNRGGSDCSICHNQEGYLYYLENNTIPDLAFDNVSALGCFTCHNPHETGTLEVRQVDYVSLANGDTFDHGGGNQCASCHHSRLSSGDITDDISVNRYWGPHHGPQGDLVNGSNGWEFPDESYTFPTSPHASVVRDACIGCHMGNPRTHVGYTLGGHSFNMTSEDAEEDDLAGLCADESCHGGAADSYNFLADADYDGDGETEGYQTEIAGLMDSLSTLLQLQLVLGGDDHPVSATIADENLAGALYNYLYLHEDRSHGIHNFKYSLALLEASIDYVDQLAIPTVSMNENLWPSGVRLESSH